MATKQLPVSRRFVTISAITLAAIAGIAVWTAIPPALDEAKNQGIKDKADESLVVKGRYIAQLGDCIACHTAEGGAAMAGGRPLETPFGTLYSTNITADKQHGIGSWSFAAFDRAMRRGVSADGHRLYPAMPYPSYAKMTDDDMQALWTYLRQEIPPVAQANQPSGMHFPFNQRWGLAYWDTVFTDKAPFVPDSAKDAVWNRGAYLVQGLGHCGACHTPRGIGFQELTMSDAGSGGKQFLSGAQVEHWNAVNLRDLWTVPDTVELLKTGQNRFSTASGNMTDVILHSTQHVSDSDLFAIATYLKSLPSDPPRPALTSTTDSATDTPPPALLTTAGGLGYTQFCVDCHRPTGRGVKGVFPALAGNPTVSASDPSTLIHITLTGWKTAATNSHPRVYTMPAFARLSDGEMAAILSFVRQAWGQGAAPVKEVDIAAARKSLSPDIDKTPFETPRLYKMLAEPNAAQLVRGMRLNTETRDLLPAHVGNDLNCTSCHLNGGTVADGSPYVGISAQFPSYAARAGKIITIEERINGCFRRSMHGKPLPLDSEDMKAMVAYFDWMKGNTKKEDKIPGRGVGKIDQAIVPDVTNGQKVYTAQCAVCHGDNGEGLKDATGHTVYPPLWGDRSFNIGAGMARTYTAAAFVKRNMPVGFHEKFPLGQGGLTDQEAVDVAEYFTHQPRPDFPDKVKDWPKDPKPKDSRY